MTVNNINYSCLSVIHKLPKLTHLHLNIDSLQGLTYLNTLPTHIKDLTLEINYCQPSTLHIFESIKHLQQLERFALFENLEHAEKNESYPCLPSSITHVDIVSSINNEQLLNLLQNAHQLRALTLRDTLVSSHVISKLPPSIRKLAFIVCENIDDTIFLELHHLPHLKKLSIISSSKITGEHIESIPHTIQNVSIKKCPLSETAIYTLKRRSQFHNLEIEPA